MNSKRPQLNHAARVTEKHFGIREHQLCIGDISIEELTNQFGTPLFIYHQDTITKTIRDLQSRLPDRFQLYYSIKANPNAAILRTVLAEGCGLEIASNGELQQALAAGCEPSQILFAGPGKTQTELSAALDAKIGEIHVESIEEARWINQLASQKGSVESISLRVNPVDTAGGAMQMGGKPSPFGVDEETLESVVSEIQQQENTKITGVHIYMGTQILDAEILLAQYHRGISIANAVAQQIDAPLATLDLGGGLGTPYFAHETELDLDAFQQGLVEIDQAMASSPWLANTKAIIEPGRFLVNEAGIYVARVTRVKRSRGKTFAVIDGGMHHHLAASGNLGQTIKRNYPLAVLNKIDEAATEEVVEIVGPLCTPLDTIGRSISLPSIEAGDLVGVFQSGAYARAASPLGFLSHPTPAEVLVSENDAHLIRRRGLFEDLLKDQQIESTNTDSTDTG
ncbi:diaminopimelate decarboxylase [Mariniblastus sp.]|nr:diaminopimelate decarboxylase [Mariniblastus sp.]